MMRLLRPALVVARRDFLATVATPTFLLFLLAPLFMMVVGAAGGLGAAQVADQGRALAQVAVLATPADTNRVRAADRDLRALFGAEDRPPPVLIRDPGRDPAATARALLAGKEPPLAVLYGLPDRPAVLHRDSGRGRRDGQYLAALARGFRAGAVQVPLKAVSRGTAPDPQAQSTGGFAAVFVMFLLTILLAGQAVGMLAEERSNKVIEILAAAVPLEAVFLGKLLGLLGVAFLFIGFWAMVALNAAAFLPLGLLATFAPPDGFGAFALLFLGYFVLAFLLFGAVFLGIGAQAGSQRELQMLTLPVTLFQVAMFGLSSTAAGAPDTLVSTVAAIFPFSSPFVMAARAATGAPAWQHAAAFVWQLLWLALTITVAARLFRRGVLKSGGTRKKRVEF